MEKCEYESSTGKCTLNECMYEPITDKDRYKYKLCEAVRTSLDDNRLKEKQMANIKITDMITSLEAIAKDLVEVKKVIDINEADGCEGCVFLTNEEWEMPCCKCRRNCKDYWRKEKLDE